jgi:hypothetical protein
MWMIRREQLLAMGGLRREAFEVRALAHVWRFFPEPCRSLGELGTRELVRRGIERARGHGFTSERDLCKYLNLVFAFGEDFGSRLPWAASILRLGGAPSRRMARLYERAVAREGKDRR